MACAGFRPPPACLDGEAEGTLRTTSRPDHLLHHPDKRIGLDTILSPVLRREWQNEGGRTREDRNCCVNRTSSSCPPRSAILVLAKGPQISDDGMADPELCRDHRDQREGVEPRLKRVTNSLAVSFTIRTRRRGSGDGTCHPVGSGSFTWWAGARSELVPPYADCIGHA